MPKIITQEDFVNSVRKIHGGSIDLSDAKYVNDSLKVKCKCNICGNIWSTKPQKLKIGHGCPVCGRKRIWEKRKDKTTTEKIVDRMKNVFNDYDFSNNESILTQKQKIKVSCPKHGEFETTADSILHGHGCRKCQYEKLKDSFSYDKDIFIKNAINAHGDYYDYRNVNYTNTDTLVRIICPKHGEFLQTPYKHVNCGHGCPRCSQSKLEEKISTLLKNNGLEFKQSYRASWLGLQHLDFFIPKLNIAIECQGEQHYKPSSFNGDKSEETLKKNFEVQIERDSRKMTLCKENNVRLIYFTDFKDAVENDVTFKDELKLVEELRKND